MFKMIVTDMDGTFLDDAKQLPEGWEAFYPKLQEAGIRFVVASGRPYGSLYAQMDAMHPDLVYIPENGSFVIQNGAVQHSSPMPRELVLQCIDAIQAIPSAHVMICAKDTMYIDSPMLREVLSDPGFAFPCTLVEDVYEPFEGIVKVSAWIEDFEAIQAHYTQICAQIDTTRLHAVTSGPTTIDITMCGTNKGTGVSYLQEKWGISPKETIVFGDQNNDIEMLEQAEYSFAMEHANASVKQAARFVTGSNNDGAVLKEIRRLTGL